jgi:cytochrome c553
MPAPADKSAVGILQSQCASCHGAAQMSGLDLRSREAALKGGARGPALLPGNSGASLLWKAAAHDGDLKMPPGKTKLSAEEISTLREWIDAGARWEAGQAATGPSWWSFGKVVRPEVPSVRNAGWVRNPIDSFILAKLERENLVPSPPASREALARRVYFDLHGLPPTPAEMQAFLADTSADAYEKLVDRLLASPRYGERWGRHWLDVARYADTGGYETDILYAHAWRYRDYVIQSFNDDKPYDIFIREQVAADEIWPDNLDLNGSYDLPKEKQQSIQRRIGTGLYTVFPIAVEYTFYGDQYRAEWQAEAVETTASAFLGLTLSCARCHDHKFDPITQKDYYRLAALFAGSEDREMPIVSQMGIYEYTRHQARIVEADHLKAYLRKLEGGGKRGKRELTAAEKDQRETMLRKIGEAYYQAPVMYAKANVLAHSEIMPESHVLTRGDYAQKGEKVTPGFPAALAAGPEIDEPHAGPFVPQRRKALAEWLTSPENGLPMRVMVNRIWQWHLGQGLVRSGNDFGRQGDRPTHPELLEWLAAEFASRRYSIKEMHRLILLSNTYRQSSESDDAKAKVDPENQLVWRMNRRRLEAEEIRDTVLAASGRLNLKLGGPPVSIPLSPEERAGMRDFSQWPVHPDYQEHNRRSVYLMVKRSFRLPMFESFDQPDSTTSCARRESSTVAPQALTLMNSSFMTSQADAIAARIRKEHPDAASWVDAGTKLLLGRAATAAEKARASRYLAGGRLEDLCLIWLNTNEFLYVD